MEQYFAHICMDRTIRHTRTLQEKKSLRTITKSLQKKYFHNLREFHLPQSMQQAFQDI